MYNNLFSLQNIATKLSELNKFEDSLRKNNILPDEEKKLYINIINNYIMHY